VRAVDLGPNPGGICMCGCGRTTGIAKRTHVGYGHVSGTHQRFIRGHAASKAAKAANGRAFWIAQDGPLDTPCHIWQGAVNSKGYPSQGTRGEKTWQVHVRALEERLGRPLKPGHQAHHRCLTPRCVNGDHLVEHTPLEHVRAHCQMREVAA
jgi:hypothetical protein